jgi:hypothetical protein
MIGTLPNSRAESCSVLSAGRWPERRQTNGGDPTFYGLWTGELVQNFDCIGGIVIKLCYWTSFNSFKYLG